MKVSNCVHLWVPSLTLKDERTLLESAGYHLRVKKFVQKISEYEKKDIYRHSYFIINQPFIYAGKKIRVIFFGDSITEAAVKPNGFITIDDSLLNSGGLGNYELMGEGISGNKVYDLYLRMEEDVISKSPDIVVIWVGVNDVWHKKMGTGTDADKFEKFYLALVRKFKAANIKVIACTPATIGEKYDNTNEQDGDMNKYSEIIRKIAD